MCWRFSNNLKGKIAKKCAEALQNSFYGSVSARASVLFTFSELERNKAARRQSAYRDIANREIKVILKTLMSVSSYTESRASSKMLLDSSEVPDFETGKSYQIRRGTTIVTHTKHLTVADVRDSEALFNQAFREGVRKGLKQFDKDTDIEDNKTQNRLYHSL